MPPTLIRPAQRPVRRPAPNTRAALRQALLAAVHFLQKAGLNHGASGNCSTRCAQGLLITPSGRPPQAMTPKDMVHLSLDGQISGRGQPSSEWRFHCDILRHRPDVGAVVHTHSPFATTLSCLRRDVPALHYMIALTGADRIRCAPYAVFGSQELSDFALEALAGSRACLLANHGMIALGETLEAACTLAQEVESLCGLYWRCLQVGGPVLLSAAQMAEAHARFAHYGGRASSARQGLD